MPAVRYRLATALRHRPLATFGATAVVAIVLAIVLFLAAGAARTLSLSDRYVEREGGTFHYDVEQISGEPLTNEVGDLPSVAHVSSITFVFGGLAGPDGQPLDSLLFVGEQSGFGTRMYAGREPTAPDEFAVTASFLETTGAAIGDRFDLLTITEEAAQASGFDAGIPPEPTVAGAQLVGAFTGPTELADGVPLAIFPPSMRDGADVGISASHHIVALAPGATRSDLRDDLDALASQHDTNFGIEEAQLVPSDVRDAITARGLGIGVVAAIVAIAAVVVLGQLLGRRTRTAENQRRLLAGIGMTPRQIVVDSVARGALPVLLAAPIASVLAIGASAWFPLGFADPVEVDDGIRLESWPHLVGPLILGTAVVIWLAAAILADRRERRPVPRTSATDALAARSPSPQLSTAVRFAFVRQPRDGISPASSVAGLATVLAALVAAVTFGASLDRVVESPARWSSAADIGIGQGGDQIAPEVVDALTADPDVLAASLSKTVTVSRGVLAIDLTGFEPLKGSITAPVLEGRRPESPDEVGLGKVTADRFGVTVGDTLSVSAPSGRVSLRVTGLVVVESLDGGDGVGRGGIVTFAGLRRLDPDAQPATAFLRVRGGVGGPAAERLGAELGIDTSGNGETPASIANLERVRALPYVIAAILAILAVLALGHQLLTSARQRRFDLGVLRAVGAGRPWVGAVVHWQASLVAAAVVVVSIPLGFLLGRAVYGRYIDRIGVANDATVSMAWLVGLLGAVLVLANLVAIVPAHRVRRSHVARDLTRE